MKIRVLRAMFMVLIALLPVFASFSMPGNTRSAWPDEKPRYPNELPDFQLYERGKLKLIKPYVSSRQDVEKILGEPVQLYSESMEGLTMGYESLPDLADWRVFVVYIGKGGFLPESLIDNVFNIRLEPKNRISLRNMIFPEVFLKGHSKDRVHLKEFLTYDDPHGLHYSLYAEDSPDGRFHKGDLKVIVYGVDDQTEAQYTRP